MKNLISIAAVALLSILLISTAGADTITLIGTIRDFNDTHPDFENGIAVDLGIVDSTLGGEGKPVYAHFPNTTPTTHGKEFFDQWYRDTAGVNMSGSLAIILDSTITPDLNVYTYANSSFFPIDNQLLENQGRDHNFHFTYEIHSQFTYQGGEEFAFMGDDDLWAFIDDRLVVDIGGVHGAMPGSVALDSLGLTIGNTYDFDLFFAERHTDLSNFRIDTSIELRQPVPEPSTLMLLGLGVVALVGIGRIRNRKV